MGAWGAGSFENDGALDWVSDFAEGGDEAMLDATVRGERPERGVARGRSRATRSTRRRAGGYRQPQEEADSPAGANTQTALGHAEGGAGVWAAMGTSLGVSARWLAPRRLEISIPKDAKEIQKETRIQYFKDIVTVTYREL